MPIKKFAIDNQIEHFLHQYRIGDLLDFTQKCGNFQSSCYSIKTSKGKFLLKTYSSIWPESHIKFDCDFLRFHANLSAKYPLPVYQTNGDLVDIKTFGSPAILLNLPGEGKSSSSFSRAQFASLGSSLACFHKQSREFFSVKTPPLNWKKFLLLLENTLPDVSNDANGIHGVYLELSKRLHEVAKTDVTFTYAMNCIEKNQMYFHGNYLSELNDFLFLYQVPLLLDFSFQVLELAVSPNLQIDFDGINQTIQSFHAKFRLNELQWQRLPEFLSLAALLKIALIHLKKSLSFENPLIDQEILFTKELYQTLLHTKTEVISGY